jgi:hypothetical protein
VAQRQSPGLVVGRVLLFALPIVTIGFLAPVPPLVAAAVDRVHRVRFLLAAGAVAVVTYTGVALLTSVPDADEDLTPRDDIGFALVCVGALAGAACALLFHTGHGPRDREPLPGVDEALERRERRARFQELAARDPRLGVELRVGRPDHPHGADDGGLLDLNALGVRDLRRHGGLSKEHARSVVEVRERLGRLTSVDELFVHGTLDLATAARLRERAVFLPRH